MEEDFRGWATKAGLKCADGRTIMSGAFKHQDRTKVPLVWQHGHTDPKNVLGHVLLEERNDGTYAFGFFNNTTEGQHSHTMLEHGDIDSMSIWANQVVEDKNGRVMHGNIREVSLVLSGANPGAKIENVTIRHGDGDSYDLDDEVVITTGLTFEHGDGTDERTLEDVYNTMNEEQQQLLHYMLAQALEETGTASQSDLEEEQQKVYNSMTEEQQKVLHDILSQAKTKPEVKHDDTDKKDKKDEKKTESKGKELVHHNVFESGNEDKGKGGGSASHVLSHSEIQGIVKTAKRRGSLREAVEDFAFSHGIEDIDVLFPEAKAVSDVPELFARRVEWVAKLMGGLKKVPFSRIKTVSADITVPEARAKGYITGAMKREEFFKVTKRSTTPTTIYKKQKLDRDDIIDITDFDVVVWLKQEMRLMLDEEIARAILVGDGRDGADPDKVDEERIRPVASDHELYTTVVEVPFDLDAPTAAMVQGIVDTFVLERSKLRGSGTPTMWTSEKYISRFMLHKDGMGRRMWKTLEEVSSELRVEDVVPVEILEEYPDIIAVIFNPVDYSVGTDQGGNVAMFDDFDIDYNEYKYLIETRLSGALTKLKAAMVLKRVAGNAVAVVPNDPTFDGTDVTIVDTAGVTYRNADTNVVLTAAGGPYAVAPGATLNVHAEPADAGHYILDSDQDDWSFTNEA